MRTWSPAILRPVESKCRRSLTLGVAGVVSASAPNGQQQTRGSSRQSRVALLGKIRFSAPDVQVCRAGPRTSEQNVCQRITTSLSLRCGTGTAEPTHRHPDPIPSIVCTASCMTDPGTKFLLASPSLPRRNEGTPQLSLHLELRRLSRPRSISTSDHTRPGTRARHPEIAARDGGWRKVAALEGVEGPPEGAQIPTT